MIKQETKPAEVTEKLLDEEQLEQVSGGDKQFTEEELIEAIKKMAESNSDEYDYLKPITDID